MDNAELLKMLKLNLEVITDYMDAEAKAAKESELLQYLNAAREFITREGIDLEEDSLGDAQILVMYASWLYGRRKAGNDYGAMPRMLRYALNNRLFEQDINGANTSKVTGTEEGS
jgi:hypothetical protein